MKGTISEIWGVMDWITGISLAIGFVGLVVSLIGSYVSYISFINPLIRFRWYLKHPCNWEIVMPGLDTVVHRNKKFPSFQIIIEYSKTLVENFHEDWMANYPDNEHNCSYKVNLFANGIFLEDLLFVSLDGGRGFVPVPRIDFTDQSRRYYYDPMQIQIASVISRYPREEKDIIDFAKHQKKKIEIRIGEKWPAKTKKRFG